MARIVQPLLEKELGQPVVVENRPGAGGMIAIDMIARAMPDGYTIGLGGAGALGTNLGLQAMPYDPRKDVAPVTGLASSPFILAASPALQGKSLRDIIAMAKQSGQTLAIGHGGTGTLMHLTAEMLNQMAGTKIELIPYTGMAPVVNDLLGGHVSLG
ncbi:MAG TPA: tripartite tricarboxylate transporter substrate binding protein, partial [Nitrospiraceae bacterium]|nr:tripartite tricarboxylate transporter substrate binding protein [Nitrospiraceae bacterium]